MKIVKLIFIIFMMLIVIVLYWKISTRKIKNMHSLDNVFIKQLFSNDQLQRFQELGIDNKIYFLLNNYDCSRCNDSLLTMAINLSYLVKKDYLILLPVNFNDQELLGFNRIYEYTFDSIYQIDYDLIKNEEKYKDKSYVLYTNYKDGFKYLYIPNEHTNTLFYNMMFDIYK